MNVEFCVPDHARLIELLLEGFIQAAELLIKSGAAGKPSLQWELRDDGAPEVWKLPNEVEASGVCDCEDLVIAWAGWLRATGVDPKAGARIANVGPKKVHCLLRRGDGKLVDIWELHRQKQVQYQMGGILSSIKGAAKSVGRGVAGAAKGVGRGAAAVGRGVKAGAQGVGRGAAAVGRGVKAAGEGVVDAAQFVAKDLPQKIIAEGASGLSGLVRGVGGGVSEVVNAVGDVVAGGAQDAIGQLGKLADVFMPSGGGGGEPELAPEAPQPMPVEYPPEDGGFDDGGFDDGGFDDGGFDDDAFDGESYGDEDFPDDAGQVDETEVDYYDEVA